MVKIMKKEDIKTFMLYGINRKVTIKECVKDGVLILFFSLISICVGAGNIIFLLLNLIPLSACVISIFKLKKGDTIEGVFYILYSGIFLVCMSYLFAMISIELVYGLFKGTGIGFVMLTMVMGYIAVILLYYYMIRRWIMKNAYSNNPEKLKGGLYFTMIGVLGISTARVFLKGMNDKSGRELLCILSMFISFICMGGIFNIVKFKYLMEHKELLDKSEDKR